MPSPEAETSSQNELAAVVAGVKVYLQEWSRQKVAMADRIARANIEHFKKMLETETDAAKRRVIERELAEEEQKLAALLKKQTRKEG
ncbi:hypothetical protein [Bradyrhizobium sp. USDA 4452]